MRSFLSSIQPRFTGPSFITAVALTALAVSCTVQGTGYTPPGDGDGDSNGVGGDAPGGSTSSSGDGDGDGDGDVGSGGNVGTPDCEKGDERACNDCGRQECDEDTLKWSDCHADAEPVCLEGAEREICDENGNLRTEACDNDDETNCSVSCDDVDGVGTCVFTAKDADDDGYSSAACEAAPGDDCDDTTDLVSPFSNEICDGLDNDCDGHVDVLDKSVDISGSDLRLGVSNGVTLNLDEVDITWHEGQFFLLAADTSQNIHSGYARTDGVADLHEPALFVSDSMNVHNSARVVSSGDTLAALIMHDGFGGAGVGFAILDPSGTIVDEFGSFGGRHGGEITSDGVDFFVSTISGATGVNPKAEFHHVQLNADDNRSGALSRTDMPGLIGYMNSAHSGGATVTVFTDTSVTPRTMQLMRATDTALQGPIQLSDDGQMGDITTLSNGNFAIAWATKDGFSLQIRRSNGSTVVCSKDTAFGNGVLDSLDSVAVAQSDLGILVLSADSGGSVGKLSLFVFDESCNMRSEQGDDLYYPSPAYDYHDNELPYLPRLAVGGGHVALAWSAQRSDDNTISRSYVRVLSETMCEE